MSLSMGFTEWGARESRRKYSPSPGECQRNGFRHVRARTGERDRGPLLALEAVHHRQLAEGTKCARSWKILTTIGADPQYPDVSPRDAKALREWEAMRKAAE